MTENEFMEMDRKQKIQQIIEKYGEDSFYLSFSGGKDSTVLSAFIDICVPGNMIPRVYADTGIELNEIRKFVKGMAEKDSRIVMIKPSVNIKKSLENDGYPFKSKDFSDVVKDYRKNGLKDNWVQQYLHLKKRTRVLKKDCSLGKAGETVEIYPGPQYSCPERLKYIFTPEFEKEHFKISDMCCINMKERPLENFAKTNKRAPITGLIRAEMGRRTSTKCLITTRAKNPKVKKFSPFAPVSPEFIDYLIDKYNIEICKLYYPPYNFSRTGCKGCPFNINLQKNLDVLEEFFPKERKQCEIIWKPVYDEYRRIGYRLKTPYMHQMTIEEALADMERSQDGSSKKDG